MFYSADFPQISSAGHSISDDAEKTVQKRQGRSQDIKEFLQQKTQ